MTQQFSERELWEQYDFLSQEMLKFLQKQDVDTFLELLQQRNFFEEKIMQSSERDFIRSEEGQGLLKRAVGLTQQALLLSRQWINRTGKQRTVGRAYEAMGTAQIGSGWEKRL